MDEQDNELQSNLQLDENNDNEQLQNNNNNNSSSENNKNKHEDEHNTCRSVQRHQDLLAPEVKSTAVVKFNLFNAPVAFKNLACNTDLNEPPTNWLTTSAGTQALHQSLYHSSEFPSFGMAHMFPDCVGKVDVVSDAENIKKLLKLPYNKKGVISMIVHKVGNTLLLDEFDIQRYLLRQASDEWNWLQTFILEQVLSLSEKNCNICLKDKSREALNRKNLLSKFLYYSLMQASNGEETVNVEPKRRNRPPAPLPLTGPVLPEPKIETNVPDPKSTHVFNRNVVWTFEDIRMLIGTDMPIFGGPNRPCISLRLRDMAKPINVLTGIDYWLDNLMCNVPEVLMCYHLDGIVQRYEIIKTEDLPELEDSQFSPQVVRNVAQNILAFLKSNATKAGHTYWLFKGRNDEVVKLYDLTTLCNHQQADKNRTHCNGEAEKQENPFTTPVAMLLYSVARNMKNTATHVGPKTAGNIKALLNNCLKLLCREKYPQIVTSSHYLLSDLHVPAGVDPKSPKFDFSDTDSDTQSLFDDDYMDTNSDVDSNYDGNEKEEDADQQAAYCHYEHGEVAMQDICETLKDWNAKPMPKNSKQRSPSPLQADTEERCRIALQHIRDGLITLQFFDANEEKFIKETEQRAKDEEKQRILHEEQHPNMAKSAKPIPLPYESLSGKKLDLATADTAEAQAQDTSDDAEVQVILQINGETNTTKETNSNEAKDSPRRYTKSPTYNPMLQNRQVAINFNSQNFGSWNAHLKLLLLEKACLVYAVLAEHYYIELKYGYSLSAIYMASRCQQVVRKYLSSIASQKSCLLGRAGDCFFQMTKHWENIDEYMLQFKQQSEVQQVLNNVLEEELDGESPELIEPVQNMEHMMVFCCRCYENALECAERTASYELQRRLGNMRNELGLKYLYWAQEEYNTFMANHKDSDSDDSDMEASNAYEERIFRLKKKLSRKCKEKAAAAANKTEPLFLCLMKKCYDCLNRAVHCFTIVNDFVNQAYVYCNLGRLMRSRAHMTLPNECDEFVTEQQILYNKAFGYYDRAKEVLVSRRANPELWDLVNWELSTAVFTLAKQLQDYGTTDNLSRSELEKEVLDVLQKALKLCDVEHPGSRQILYTYRAGLVHKRIASFHYNHLRMNALDGVVLSKTSLQLCKHHYEKAADIFDAIKEAFDLITVQLERISLFEWLSEQTNYPLLKIKNMQTVLDICLSSKTVFEQFKSLQVSNDSTDSTSNTSNASDGTANENNNDNNRETVQRYIMIFQNRLQNCLKTLTKLTSSTKDPKKLVDLYKQMYMETLKQTYTAGEQKKTIEELSTVLYELITKLLKMQKSD